MPRILTSRLVPLGVACLGLLMWSADVAGETRRVVLSGHTVNVRLQLPGTMIPTAVVVVASGADGWRGLTSVVGDRLSAEGLAVIGLDTRSYLTEATRRSGALTTSEVRDDYLIILRRAHEWFPDAQQTFLLGVSEGAALTLVAAADPRVGARLTGVVGLDTPGTVSLRAPYWNWTSWITHRESADVSITVTDYIGSVAPVPLAFIFGSHDIAERSGRAQAIFDRGGQPRRLAVIETERPLFDGARERLFAALDDCLAWSVRVTPSRSHVESIHIRTVWGAR